MLNPLLDFLILIELFLYIRKRFGNGPLHIIETSWLFILVFLQQLRMHSPTHTFAHISAMYSFILQHMRNVIITRSHLLSSVSVLLLPCCQYKEAVLCFLITEALLLCRDWRYSIVSLYVALYLYDSFRLFLLLVFKLILKVMARAWCLNQLFVNRF